MVASPFSPEARARKWQLLAALESASVTRPDALAKLHKALCSAISSPTLGSAGASAR